LAHPVEIALCVGCCVSSHMVLIMVYYCCYIEDLIGSHITSAGHGVHV